MSTKKIYQSTRSALLTASPAQAVMEGIAPDGGLYTLPSFADAAFDYQAALALDTLDTLVTFRTLDTLVTLIALWALWALDTLDALLALNAFVALVTLQVVGVGLAVGHSESHYAVGARYVGNAHTGLSGRSLELNPFCRVVFRLCGRCHCILRYPH